MKRQCITPGVLLLTSLFLRAQAQTVRPSTQHWAPDSGFWQLIIPAGHRKATIVQFYSPDSRLLHEDRLTVGLNPNRRKTRKLLYNELQKYLQERVLTAQK